MLEGRNYRISAANVLGHELIGLEATVTRSPDRGKTGIKGKIVDETRNVLVIEEKGQEKKIPKNEASFLLKIGDEKKEVDGKKLVARPEDRVKLFFRRKG